MYLNTSAEFDNSTSQENSALLLDGREVLKHQYQITTTTTATTTSSSSSSSSKRKNYSYMGYDAV